jgi:hypothetical protein
MRQTPIQAMCVRIALDLNIFQILAEAKGDDITASELASQSKAESRLVIRIMRVFTASGYGDETGVDTYRSNVVSEAMLDPGMVASFRLAYVFASVY